MLHYVFHAAKIGKKWICGVSCGMISGSVSEKDWFVYRCLAHFFCKGGNFRLLNNLDNKKQFSRQKNHHAIAQL